MSTRIRKPRPIPAALQPTPATTATRAPRAQPAAPVTPDPETIHVAILVPHPKLAEVIRNHVVVAGPANRPYRVQGHVILENPKHRAASVPMQVRIALIENGLVNPEDVDFTFPEQVTLGWPKESS